MSFECNEKLRYSGFAKFLLITTNIRKNININKQTKKTNNILAFRSQIV